MRESGFGEQISNADSPKGEALWWLEDNPEFQGRGYVSLMNTCTVYFT